MRALLGALLLGICANAMAFEEKRIAKEVTVKATPEEVWKAWTTKEGLQSFFAPEAVVEPRTGGAFFVHFNPYGKPGMKGADDMRILGVQENRMLSFTWNAPPDFPDVRANQRTVVIVRMRPVEGGTHVTLAHYGWGEGGEWDGTFAYFDRAWGSVLGNLQKRFAEGPVDWGPFLARIKGAAK